METVFLRLFSTHRFIEVKRYETVFLRLFSTCRFIKVKRYRDVRIKYHSVLNFREFNLSIYVKQKVAVLKAESHSIQQCEKQFFFRLPQLFKMIILSSFFSVFFRLFSKIKF